MRSRGGGPAGRLMPWGWRPGGREADSSGRHVAPGVGGEKRVRWRGRKTGGREAVLNRARTREQRERGVVKGRGSGSLGRARAVELGRWSRQQRGRTSWCPVETALPTRSTTRGSPPAAASTSLSLPGHLPLTTPHTTAPFCSCVVKQDGPGARESGRSPEGARRLDPLKSASAFRLSLSTLACSRLAQADDPSNATAHRSRRPPACERDQLAIARARLLNGLTGLLADLSLASTLSSTAGQSSPGCPERALVAS